MCGREISLLTGFCYKSGVSGWYLKHTRKYTDHVRKGDIASFRFFWESGLSGWYLKHTRKYTDHVREGDIASFRFLLEVWSFRLVFETY